MNVRDAYVQKLKARIKELNADIDILNATTNKADAAARINYYKHLENLRKKRKDVEDKLFELQHAGEGAWEDLKQGLENSWKILKTSLSEAKSEFERGYREGSKED